MPFIKAETDNKPHNITNFTPTDQQLQQWQETESRASQSDVFWLTFIGLLLAVGIVAIIRSRRTITKASTEILLDGAARGLRATKVARTKMTQIKDEISDRETKL